MISTLPPTVIQSDFWTSLRKINAVFESRGLSVSVDEIIVDHLLKTSSFPESGRYWLDRIVEQVRMNFPSARVSSELASPRGMVHLAYDKRPVCVESLAGALQDTFPRGLVTHSQSADGQYRISLQYGS